MPKPLMPVPADVNYEMPQVSEAQFSDPNFDTDAFLEKGGEWDADEDDDLSDED